MSATVIVRLAEVEVHPLFQRQLLVGTRLARNLLNLHTVKVNHAAAVLLAQRKVDIAVAVREDNVRGQNLIVIAIVSLAYSVAGHSHLSLPSVLAGQFKVPRAVVSSLA